MNSIKQSFFVYSCSEKSDLKTLIEPTSDNLGKYENQDCEKLKKRW